MERDHPPAAAAAPLLPRRHPTAQPPPDSSYSVEAEKPFHSAASLGRSTARSRVDLALDAAGVLLLAVCRPLYCVLTQYMLWVVSWHYFHSVDAWRTTAAHWPLWCGVGDLSSVMSLGLALREPGRSFIASLLYPPEGAPRAPLLRELTAAAFYFPLLCTAAGGGAAGASLIVYGTFLAPSSLGLSRLGDRAGLYSLAVWPTLFAVADVCVFCSLLLGRAEELVSELWRPGATTTPRRQRGRWWWPGVPRASAVGIVLLAWCLHAATLPLYMSDRSFTAYRTLAGVPLFATLVALYLRDRSLVPLIASYGCLLSICAAASIAAGRYDWRVPY